MPAPTHIALLRGINVGGKNKLPMKDAAAIFARAGCADVQTYIASGNILFTASAACAKKVPRTVAEAIEKKFGLKVPVVLRTAAELRAVPAANPFPGAEDRLHVLFLADKPTTAQLAALDPGRSPGDEFTVRGRDIYLNLGTGVADTKLTNAYFDSKLGTVSTGRNWRTVLKLVEMAGGG